MKRYLLLFIFCLLSPCTTHAGDHRPVFLSEAGIAKHRYTIERIERYLSNITTLVSDFTQIAPDGSLAEGTFYLQRPGKMRWQYAPPTPILMVANGSEIIFYDQELEQVTHIPLDDSLIGFLGRSVIRFGQDVGITAFTHEAKIIRVGLAQLTKPGEGRLELEFSDQPLQLRRLLITDTSGQMTTIALDHAQFGVPVASDLFIFKDPRKKRR